MKKVVHLTDIHVCPEGEMVVDLDPRERLLAVVQSINHSHADADLCVITGDLTDRGDTASYETLRRYLEPLRIPHRLMLGNHDRRTAFQSVFPDAGIDDSGFVQSVVDFNDSALVMLDTLDENRATGLLCKERLNWLRKQLDARPNKRVVLFMHHPPKAVGVPWFDQNMLLAEPQGFLSLIDEFPAIEHICFGHLHLTVTGHWNGLSFSCNRGTCHRIVLGFSATEVAYVESEPTYDVILIGDDGVVVHHTAPVESASRLIARERMKSNGRSYLEYFDAAADAKKPR